MPVTFEAPRSFEVSCFFWRSYNLQEDFDRFGLELDELETDVEPSRSALFERVYPDDLRRVCHRLYVR
jgi:hypothetical protein